jgi:glycosyltransferase involved in cell wall biosynthesis
MFAGHFDEVRGVSMFLDLVSLIPDDDVVFWVSGHGTESEIAAVRDRVSALNDQRVIFFGTLPWQEYKQRLVAADVLLNMQNPNHPISKYTFPSKILDYMSSGTLVVSTDMLYSNDSLLDIVVEGGTNPSEICDTLDHVFAGDYDVERREQTGKQWIREHCAYDRVGAVFTQTIENI